MAENTTSAVAETENATAEPTVEIPVEAFEPNLSSETADGVEGDAKTAAEAAIREATAAGWVPKEEWKGPAGKWKPANEFLQFRDSVLPLVQKENRSLREANANLERRLAAVEAAERERGERSEQLSVETLKYEKRQAQEVGDWQKVGELDEKIIAATVKQATKPQPAQPTIAPAIQEAITAFVENNDWAKEPEMGNVLAETLFTMKQVGSINGLTPEQALERAKDRIKRIYPEKFARSRASTPPAFGETGGMNGNHRGNVRGWSDLKPDTRAQLEPLLAQPGMTKEGILKQCAKNPTEYFMR